MTVDLVGLLHRKDPAAAADAASPGHGLLARLEASAIFRDYQGAFQATLGLPLTLQPADAFQALGSEPSPLGSFGLLLAEQQRNRDGPAPAEVGETRVLGWGAGLCESAVAVRLGARVMGYLRTGPVLLLPPTAARFDVLVRRLRRRPAGFDAARLRSAYLVGRVMTRLHYASVLRLLVIFAQHLALLGSQLMLAAVAAESLSITKARQYLTANHGQELSLLSVAQAAHLSPFYFSRRFRQETGQTFTVYLARLRIEAVKLALLQPDMRITQAAFAAGFQSLSQFNRVYRHVEGESPSDYRHRLEQPARAAQAG